MKLDFKHAALVIIDVQNDFCPGGTLEVKNGDEVVKPLNFLSSLFSSRSGRVIATQDWHPEGHISFASSHEGRKPGDIMDLPDVKGQVLWPDHCVSGSEGAGFHKELDLKPISLIIRKGINSALDSYSAFFENDRKSPTGLDGFLKVLSIDTLVLGGLALDYCVLYSALDAVKLGYKTIIAEDSARAVDFPSGSANEALKLLKNEGVIVSASGEIQ